MNSLRRSILAASILIGAVAACKSLGTPEEQSTAVTLWDSIAGYQQWGSFEGHQGMQPGKNPHGEFIQTFVNPIVAQHPESPAFGSIIVKENYSSKQPESFNSITVMQRIAGFDAENNDWFWARYTPSGELTHSGKVEFCSDCHFDAGNDDFVFLND